MIEGLSHMTFIVSDLERMSRILEGVFDAKQVYASGDHTFSLSEEKFFLIGDIWVAIMKGDPLPARSYNHIAFKIAEEDFDRYRARIDKLGLDLLPPRPRVEGEGRSLYFHDDDNHLFELHTGTLEQRLRRYAADSEPR
ncbi:FosX/FosE/FosI family fosfomycin resistance hydrolase [Martelella sp. AD-3]|uniref:FosX/FosE/FosI family fosfomycin resistance hydrolase n=1 Tax=Martelella sp. AD-3 TaxID=686597 RepID=UPI00046769CA|nr:FosX/FosE/FosI family fosfomycin resistance hydrolase [Martelella sp. AD-3]AMM86515.1 fosmidomycin resistance protein [Martelella sp. AD-3]MAM12780.1 FosX/FosE/FosI family fosfomycin resistance thiol transferase [Rhizobiaceae bacterium]